MIDAKLLLFMILRFFGGLKLNDFDDRLILQKRIYLLQFFGFPLDYRYNWYVRGPYCPQLTEEAYQASGCFSEIQEQVKGFELTAESKEIIGKYKLFEAEFDKQPLPLMLELAASIHYLIHIGFLPGNKDAKNIAESLRQRRKIFIDDQFLAAWNALNKFGLIDNKMTS